MGRRRVAIVPHTHWDREWYLPFAVYRRPRLCQEVTARTRPWMGQEGQAAQASRHDRPLPGDALFLGEVGLGGEIRPVGGVERRLGDAARQGFRRVFASARARVCVPGLEVVGVDGIGELARHLAA